MNNDLLALNRPALIARSDVMRLDQEYRAARWIHHRLLDFEDQHQRVLDETSEQVAPGILRVGRILSRLARRARRAERASKGSWKPKARPELTKALRERLDVLRKQRNADPRWKAACTWADEQVGETKRSRRRLAKPAEKVKRRKGESDEAFAKRFDLLTHDETEEHYAAKLAAAPRATRRDVYRLELYGKRHIYWGTWNALVRSVNQARSKVLKRRKQGLPSEWRRPRWDDPLSLAADAGGFRIVERGPLWWTIEMRVGIEKQWVRFRAKCGNWHEIPESAKIRTAQLTRRRDGQRWVYTVSLVVEGAKKKAAHFAGTRVVSFDWGHREHGHDRQAEGIRAWTWHGDDEEKGEILIPRECREALDQIDELKSRVDKAFDARKEKRGLPDKTRHGYRRRLMRLGVRTEEEADWLRWETRYERRMSKRRKRVQNLRRETYLKAVRELRKHYSTFAFEDETGWSLRKQDIEEKTRHRKRSNRDLATRYEFVAICERFGAQIVTVPARNTTRECPERGCEGLLPENGPELVVACPACGTVRDKDYGAARVILRRAQEALANAAQ